ncbi:MAG: DNA (cytosine-5-)-methyltransferase [Candidatus Lokiarchaeota archaeon]|nr:DNA (cytosine-5-)-methyltransferase [Candidatus Lokiarchaeota archaeon]
MKVVDLFCGAGGFSYGFAHPSQNRHLAIDIDSFVLETYAQNYPQNRVLKRDIAMLHSTSINSALEGLPDVILASPPCEEFSRANPDSRSSAAERIYGGGTARLLLDTIRIIGDLEPTVFVIENVAALSASGGKRIILKEFQSVGISDVNFNLIRCHRHGNPSKRVRLFISNLRLDLPRRTPPSVMDVIGDLPRLGIDAILDPGKAVPNHDYRPIPKDKLKKVRKTRRGRGAKHFRVSKSRSLPNWVRLYPDSISTSIIGLSRYIHPFENRLLTVREHARLMSYPDSFTFTGPITSQYNQVGESVPPLISCLIAQEVSSYLEKSK